MTVAEPVNTARFMSGAVFQKATESELLALVVVANEYGLNPFLKEIYAFPAKGGGIVPVVSIDGWLRMVNDHPQMDGIVTNHRENEDSQREHAHPDAEWQLDGSRVNGAQRQSLLVSGSEQQQRVLDNDGEPEGNQERRQG